MIIILTPPIKTAWQKSNIATFALGAINLTITHKRIEKTEEILYIYMQHSDEKNHTKTDKDNNLRSFLERIMIILSSFSHCLAFTNIHREVP